jgi:UPF0755 protein
MKILLKFFWFMFLLCIATAGFFALQMNDFLQKPLALSEEGMQLEVKPGASLRSLAQELEQKKVISSHWYLYAYARFTGKGQGIKVGDYQLDQGIKPTELLDLLSSGKVVQHSLTLVEGWRFKDILEKVRQHPMLDHSLTDETPEEVMAILGYANQHPEGRFYPDTYHIVRGTRDIDLLKRAYEAMERELAAAWAKRAQDTPLKDPYEALILASIVEKETGAASERPAIAGVFSRRLEKGMRLQTDPTVIYGMGEKYQGNIRRKDLREDTPYNTYVHAGLPPTPICMPGRAALEAAVNPAAGKSLYFVAKGDGTHEFSDNLRAHNNAVNKYQRRRNKK